MGAVLASCLGSCCGAAACAGFSACCSCNCFLSLPYSRALYTATIFCVTAAALVAKYLGGQISGNADCAYCGDEGVLRIFFGLAATFCTLALLTLGDTRFGSYVHTGFWFAKLCALVCFGVAGAFVPIGGLLAFGEACRWVAMLFLLFQIVMLIDLAYGWNESWLSKDDELGGEFRWRAAILAVATLLFAGSLAAVALMLQYLAADGCTLNTALISCTLVAAVLLTVLSVSPVAEHGALLTSAVVSSYAVYLCYSALAAAPDAVCNPLIAQGYDSVRLALGLLFGAVSIAYCAWAYGSTVNESEVPPPSAAATVTGEASDPFTTLARGGRGTDTSSGIGVGDEADALGARGVCLFQIIMVAVSCYGATLLTGWRAAVVGIDRAPGAAASSEGLGSGGVDGALPYALSWASVWIQIACLVATVLLYTWSLLAPRLFPDRDFGMTV
jgi:hypothetical protein